MAAPTVTLSSTANASYGGSFDRLDLDFSGATSGNLLLAFIVVQGNNASFSSAPSGWTLDGSTGSGGTNSGDSKLYRFSRTSDESEGTVTFVADGLIQPAAAGLEVAGWTGTPVVVPGDTFEGSQTSHTVPSVTTPADDSLVLAVLGLGGVSTPTFTEPTGYTPLVNLNGSGNSGLGVSSKDYATAGATGDVTYTSSSAGNGAEWHIALESDGSGASLSGTVQSNGFDVLVTATNTTPGNYTVKAGASGSETARTVQSVRQVNATQVRLRLANGDRILSTDASVLVSSTADGVTDEAATNSSQQTGTTIWSDRFVWTFASPPTVGILRSGEPTVTDAEQPTGVSYDPGDGEEQYTIHGSMLNPESGSAAEHPFHPEAAGYNASTAVSYPLTLSADDCLVAAAAFPAASTHATSTAFSVGDVIEEAGRWFRCTTAGTTAGTKPTFQSSSSTVTDGTVVWTRGRAITGTDADEGRSPVRKVAILHCSGSTLKSQDTFRCAYTDGATKTYYTGSQIDTGVLPSDSNGFTDISGYETTVRQPWYELGYGNGGSDSEAIPEDYMPAYGQHIQRRATSAILGCLSDSSYTDDLVDYCIQRGIDYIGHREAGGAYQVANGGWSNGRMALPLFAAKILGVEDTAIPKLRSNANGDWRGTEFAEQVTYLTSTDIARTNLDGYDYGEAGLGTYVDPTTTPSTYGDSPSDAYFPASVRGTWLHVPEWGLRHASQPDRSTPRWSVYYDTHYRFNVGQTWTALALVCQRLGVIDDVNVPEFFDYVDRYVSIESPDYDAQSAFDSLYTANRATFAVSSASLNGSTLTVTFNRYCTWSAANDGAWALDSGTLSGWTQIGPREWQATVSGTPTQLTYTAASGDATDAGGTDLTDQTVSINSADLTPDIPDALSLGDATVGEAYSQTINVTSGDLPLTMMVSAGTLPDGLSLSKTGDRSYLISGTPTTAGDSTFTLSVEDTDGDVDTQEASISVAAAVVSPTITTTTLPDAEEGTAYSQDLAATGDEPITWTLTAGSLPTGLSLSSGGTISGTPTTTGSETFTVTATNSGGSDEQELTLTVGEVDGEDDDTPFSEVLEIGGMVRPRYPFLTHRGRNQLRRAKSGQPANPDFAGVIAEALYTRPRYPTLTHRGRNAMSQEQDGG